MTRSQLYLEVWNELHPDKPMSEREFLLANAIVPECTVEEIPPEIEDTLRLLCRKVISEVDRMTNEQCNQMLRAHLIRN